MSDFCYDQSTIDRIYDQAKLMDRMMHVLAVDSAGLRRDAGASWYAARLQCIDCPNVPECKQWLATAEQDYARQPADFCPNQPLFKSCAGQKEFDF